MGSHQMNERQILDSLVAGRHQEYFQQYVEEYGLAEIAEIFSKGLRVEVGDMLPSEAYAERLKHVPAVWKKPSRFNATEHPAVRASCVEFVLAGLYSMDRISRTAKHASSIMKPSDRFFLA